MSITTMPRHRRAINVGLVDKHGGHVMAQARSHANGVAACCAARLTLAPLPFPAWQSAVTINESYLPEPAIQEVHVRTFMAPPAMIAAAGAQSIGLQWACRLVLSAHCDDTLLLLEQGVFAPNTRLQSAVKLFKGRINGTGEPAVPDLVRTDRSIALATVSSAKFSHGARWLLRLPDQQRVSSHAQSV